MLLNAAKFVDTEGLASFALTMYYYIQAAVGICDTCSEYHASRSVNVSGGTYARCIASFSNNLKLLLLFCEREPFPTFVWCG